MIALRRRTISAAILTLALGWTVAGCSSDEGGTTPGVNSAVVGTWNATSFIVWGTDLIPPLIMSLVLNGNGAYSLNFSNDQGDLCDAGQTSCGETGTYKASNTQIILDAGSVDEATLNYSIVGTTMTVTATIDASSFVIILTKA